MSADNVIHVEFYGVLTERAGQSSLDLPVVPDTTLAVVLEQLAAQLPDIASHLPTTACAVNDEIVQRSVTIAPGSTLALLPPVSGG